MTDVGFVVAERTTPATAVLTPAQARALASPSRLAIVEAFGALGRAGDLFRLTSLFMPIGITQS
jgi:hypothetical protein